MICYEQLSFGFSPHVNLVINEFERKSIIENSLPEVCPHGWNVCLTVV